MGRSRLLLALLLLLPCSTRSTARRRRDASAAQRTESTAKQRAASRLEIEAAQSTFRARQRASVYARRLDAERAGMIARRAQAHADRPRPAPHLAVRSTPQTAAADDVAIHGVAKEAWSPAGGDAAVDLAGFQSVQEFFIRSSDPNNETYALGTPEVVSSNEAVLAVSWAWAGGNAVKALTGEPPRPVLTAPAAQSPNDASATPILHVSMRCIAGQARSHVSITIPVLPSDAPSLATHPSPSLESDSPYLPLSFRFRKRCSELHRPGLTVGTSTATGATSGTPSPDDYDRFDSERDVKAAHAKKTLSDVAVDGTPRTAWSFASPQHLKAVTVERNGTSFALRVGISAQALLESGSAASATQDFETPVIVTATPREFAIGWAVGAFNGTGENENSVRISPSSPKLLEIAVACLRHGATGEAASAEPRKITMTATLNPRPAFQPYKPVVVSWTHVCGVSPRPGLSVSSLPSDDRRAGGVFSSDANVVVDGDVVPRWQRQVSPVSSRDRLSRFYIGLRPQKALAEEAAKNNEGDDSAAYDRPLRYLERKGWADSESFRVAITTSPPRIVDTTPVMLPSQGTAELAKLESHPADKPPSSVMIDALASCDGGAGAGIAVGLDGSPLDDASAHQAASSSLLEQKQRQYAASRLKSNAKRKEREISAVATDVAVSVDKPVSPYAVVLDQPNIWTGFGVRYDCVAHGNPVIGEHGLALHLRNHSTTPDALSRAAAAQVVAMQGFTNPIDAKKAAAQIASNTVSIGAAHADVTIKLVGQHGWKAPALRLQKRCGGHKRGLNVWIPSGQMREGGHAGRRFLFPAGRSTIPLADSDEEEERTARLLEMSQQAREEEEALPGRTMVAVDGVVDLPWSARMRKARRTRDYPLQVFDAEAHALVDEEQAVVPASASILELHLEMGKSAAMAPGRAFLGREARMVTLPRSHRVLHVTQQVKFIRVQREDNASKSFVTLELSGTLVHPQIARENELRGKLERAAWLSEQERGKLLKKGSRHIIAHGNSSKSIQVSPAEEPEWPRVKAEVTNLTYIDVPHTVKRWSQTLNVHHHCPTFGWFPKIWGAGMYGKYANISIEVQFAKPVYAPLRLHYRKHCGGWLASPIGITGAVSIALVVALASYWLCCRTKSKRGKRT